MKTRCLHNSLLTSDMENLHISMALRPRGLFEISRDQRNYSRTPCQSVDSIDWSVRRSRPLTLRGTARLRERAALMESYGGSSGDEISDSELEEVPTLEEYTTLMVERHDNSIIAVQNIGVAVIGVPVQNNSVLAVTPKPREFFQQWAMRIRKDRVYVTNQEKQVSGRAFSKYRKTVAVPIAPLDDSNGAVVYEDVVAWVHRYKALFTARGSVMVLPELLN